MTRVPLALLVLLACKPKHRCEQPDAPVQLQMLARADPVLNPGETGASWPTTLRVYQLKAGAELDRLDFVQVLTTGEQAFGDAFIKAHEYTVFPAKRGRWNLELAKDAAHVVTVALFRQPVGDAWYQVYNVPQDHNAQRCALEEEGRDLPDPCIYLAFEHNEVNGGKFPPAGFDVAVFETSCAPVVARAKTAKKPRKRRRLPTLPSLPRIPDSPKTPQTPRLPQTPTPTPATPAAPQAPQAPQAPPSATLRPR